MSYVALIGGASTLGAAAIKSNAASEARAGGGSGFMGGFGQSLTDASSATYGTTIGDDGWSINFGAGTQMASPTKTVSDSYSKDLAQSQPNPLTGMTQRLPSVAYGSSSSVDPQTLLILAALGGFVLLRR